MVVLAPPLSTPACSLENVFSRTENKTTRPADNKNERSRFNNNSSSNETREERNNKRNRDEKNFNGSAIDGNRYDLTPTLSARPR